MSDDDFDPIAPIRARLTAVQQAENAEQRLAAGLALIEHAVADIALLLDLVDHLEDENDALHAEVERLTPPADKPHPSVERAMARFKERLAEVTSLQEDDGEAG